MTPKLTAIVCTYNRLSYLTKALASLRVQTLPTTDLEIIVVNNASTDETETYLKEQSLAISNLKTINETRLGLCAARNAGWNHATAELIAFLDDDAIAAPDWAERIVLAYEKVSPTPACIGGTTTPIWELPRPAWLSDHALGTLSIVAWSETPKDIEPGEYLVGANISFRKDSLISVGGFPEALGRKGQTLLSGEDTYVVRELQNAGQRIYYDPTVVVQHHIPGNRLTQDWHFRREYWQGISSAIRNMELESFSPFIQYRRVVRLFLSLITSPREVYSLFVSIKDPRWFDYKRLAIAKLGYILQLIGKPNLLKRYWIET